jgi:hypothetical protein
MPGNGYSGTVSAFALAVRLIEMSTVGNRSRSTDAVSGGGATSSVSIDSSSLAESASCSEVGLPHCGQKKPRTRIDAPQKRQRREISGSVIGKLVTANCRVPISQFLIDQTIDNLGWNTLIGIWKLAIGNS